MIMKRDYSTHLHFGLMALLVLLNILILLSIPREVTAEKIKTIDIMEVTVTPKPTIEPTVEDINTEEEIEPRYGFTDEDIYLLAQLLCGSKSYDGDGEYDIDFEDDINYHEVSKVLTVVMNRVRSNRFPNTVREVVLQDGQFSPMPENLKTEPSDVALRTVKEWCECYDLGISFVQAVPETHLFFRGDGFTNTTRERFHDD
jgi:hypothetical protein